MKKLNKFISDSGYCSRREADKYIAEGRVTINNVDATIGSMVEEGDAVEVDGEKIGKKAKRAVYIAFNKPVGVTSTTDREDKTNIIDYISYKERIFHVGRLDKDSEGLIILTNDGDIVNKILRAGNENPKEYIVTVDHPITSEFLKEMSSGVRIMGVKTKPCKVVRKNETTFVIYLTQGLNRQIRRMCDVLGYKVRSLKRTRVMNISLGSLETGQWRYFTPEEITEMKRLLEASVGTEEASNEKKAVRTGPRKVVKPGSYADYRRKSSGGDHAGKYAADKPEGKRTGADGKNAANRPEGKRTGADGKNAANRPEGRRAKAASDRSEGRRTAGPAGKKADAPAAKPRSTFKSRIKK